MYPDLVILEKHETKFGSRYATVETNGQRYHVGVERGKSVRIPFKPRGQNRGWKYVGVVRKDGRCLWSGDVPKSCGVRRLLELAGVGDGFDNSIMGCAARMFAHP